MHAVCFSIFTRNVEGPGAVTYFFLHTLTREKGLLVLAKAENIDPAENR